MSPGTVMKQITFIIMDPCMAILTRKGEIMILYFYEMLCFALA